MKETKNAGAQGDVLFVRVSEIPNEVPMKTAEHGQYILAHSETGHHLTGMKVEGKQ